MGRILCLQHVTYETPATIAEWAALRGHTVESFLVPEQGLPQKPPGKDDFLLIMGGPMGVYEADAHPWIHNEIAFIQQSLDQACHIMGICLGSQLIAAAAGASVHPHEHKEIGWFDVTIHPQARQHPFVGALPEVVHSFHWHGDSFHLPPAAEWIGSSQATPHQGFTLGDRVVALQFHMEVCPKDVTRWLDRHPELPEGSYVQSPESMLICEARFHIMRQQLFTALDAWQPLP